MNSRVGSIIHRIGTRVAVGAAIGAVAVAVLTGGGRPAFAVNNPTISTNMTPVPALAGHVMAGTASVNPEATITDHATLAGATVDAGGTITYKIFTDSACTLLANNTTAGAASKLDGAIVATATSLKTRIDILSGVTLPSGIALEPGTASQDAVTVSAKSGGTGTTLKGAIVATATSLTVPRDIVGSISLPTDIVLEPGSATKEEVVSVSAKSGGTATTLSGAIGAGATSLVVPVDIIGAPPAEIVLEPGTTKQEIVTVSAKVGAGPYTYTVGATTFAHANGIAVATPATYTVSATAFAHSNNTAVALPFTYTVSAAAFAHANAVTVQTANRTVQAAVVPASKSFTISGPGTFYWQAQYSGDQNNTGATSVCTSEQVIADAMVSDHLPHANAIRTNTSMYDTAALSGVTANAGGTIQYKIWSNSTCTTLLSDQTPGSNAVVNGIAPNSLPYTFTVAGTYYWQVIYSGDANNAGGTTDCQGEAIGVSASAINVVEATTTLSPSTPVAVGSSVSDQMTLIGATTTAGGTVSYNIYSDAACGVLVANVTPGGNTVVNGIAPASLSHAFPTAGIYYWQATYSGDAANHSVTTPCGAEKTTVENIGTLSVSPASPTVLEGGTFTVSIMQNASVATSGAEANIGFDPAVLQVVSVDRGSAYPADAGGGFPCSPNCGNLVAGVDGQTVPQAITAANGSGTLNAASVSYNTAGGEPSVPSGSREALKVKFLAFSGVNLTTALTLSAPNMLDATNGLDMVVTPTGASVDPGDRDGDGCTDVKEALGDWHLGGQRDGVNNWDFFDVPTPVLLPANMTGVRTKAITIGDVIAILSYIGTSSAAPNTANSAGAKYGTDLNNNGILDGVEYDRTPGGFVGEPWRTAAPNGAVQIGDAIVDLNGVGTNCT